MWLRRQTTKYNGTAYIVQRGAEAVFTPEGMATCRANIEYYKENARIMADALTELGGTPGSGFGKCGEGYFRLTAFNTHENTAEAMARLKKLLKK